MTSRRVEPSGASRASSQASTASTMAPSVCASVKRKSVQIEAPIDDVDIDLAVIGDFDVSASSEEAEATERPKSQMEAPPPVIPSTKMRKTSAVWECYPKDKFVTIGYATYAVCKKKAMGKDLVVGGQTILGFERSTLGVPTPTVVKTKTSYEHPKVREALAHMVMISELPFNFVEHPDFINFCHVLQPLYEKVGRKQVKADCFRVYQAERERLKKVFEETRRISITTDLWKSDHQSIEYMVLTAHWVDQSWSLNKQIINFVHLPPPRRGIDIAAAIFDCLKGWGIEHKVETVTVDNASANDNCVKRLKEDFQMQRSLLCDGKLFHVRCTAHIVNLLVQDGVAVIKPIIDNVRESVKFVKASEARQKTFAKIAMQCGIKERKLVLDCATRWNSTYKMLMTALQFREVFLRFMFVESSYIYCPTREEWERLEVVCDFLEIFDDITKLISGSQYTTVNRYFQEVFRIKEVLRE
ncbi:zinc finger BED domain-containing protein RICESLEEPER 2-like [Mangifera indica]|uniref:zinc finger BED domain-containing protein RICESLEEPER 2-like n=1 Tax=Mangifera indica TaxID=29780 RepID=UPI001CFACDE9|nr:zinc finger BED domain-containing protein RICESLEEPER 2-like [Mangifera indica]